MQARSGALDPKPQAHALIARPALHDRNLWPQSTRASLDAPYEEFLQCWVPKSNNKDCLFLASILGIPKVVIRIVRALYLSYSPNS